MSNKAITWAFDQELPTIDKFVLVVLADYADEANSCFPGQQKIAANTGASVSTVRRALGRLERHKLIARDRRQRRDGSRTSDRYTLQLEPVDNPVGNPSGQIDL
jgi:DNA-binding transcriptional MocR family regulator